MSFSSRPTTGPAPQTIIERGRSPSFGAAASIASGRPGIIVGDQMDDRPERRAGLIRQREPDVGAAGVADEDREGKGESAHGPP